MLLAHDSVIIYIHFRICILHNTGSFKTVLNCSLNINTYTIVFRLLLRQEDKGQNNPEHDRNRLANLEKLKHSLLINYESTKMFFIILLSSYSGDESESEDETGSECEQGRCVDV